MQHRYVPDLGDFSKFAVIDALSGQGEARTALIWYLVDPEEVGDQHNNDGKHTTYLENDRQGLAECHPELYQKFQDIHLTGEKNVGIYGHRKVLPNINYFSDQLSYDNQSLALREACRASWLDRALRVAANTDVVVLDPDNGLMADRISIRSLSAVKYATLDECRAFYAGGQRTLVVYQHAHRQGSAEQQATRALQRLANHLEIERRNIFALRFHRGTTRFYLTIPAAGDEELIRDRAESLIDSEWGRRGHFSLID